MGEGIHLYGDRAPHNEEFVVLTASSNLTEERVLTGTANQITITDNGAGGTVVLSIPSGLIIPGTITIPNTGLHILDTGGDHDLIIAPGSDLSADRTLTLTTGDAARTITLSGNPTLNDWFDQSVKVAASPTFADVFVPDGGTFGISGNELLTFNAAGTAVFSGCNVGIGAWTEGTLHVHTATAGGVEAHASGDELIVENSTTGGISILTPNASSGYIIWGSPANNAHAYMYANQTTAIMTIGGITRMQLNCPLQILEAAAAVADSAAYGQLWVKNDTPSALRYTDDAGNEVISISNSLLQHSGAIASATSTFSTAGPTDNVNVAGINTLFLDCSGNDVIIGGFIGGVAGQYINIARLCDAAFDATLEHAEVHAFQKIYLHAKADETVVSLWGGWFLVCDGTHWYDVSHAKHVA